MEPKNIRFICFQNLVRYKHTESFTINDRIFVICMTLIHKIAMGWLSKIRLAAKKPLRVSTGRIANCAVCACHQCSLKIQHKNNLTHRTRNIKDFTWSLKSHQHKLFWVSGNLKEYNSPLIFFNGERGDHLTRVGRGLRELNSCRIIASTRKYSVAYQLADGKMNYTMSLHISSILEQWSKGLHGMFTYVTSQCCYASWNPNSFLGKD